MGLKPNERKYMEKETDPFKDDYNWDCKFGVFLAILGTLCFGSCVALCERTQPKESTKVRNSIVQAKQQMNMQNTL